MLIEGLVESGKLCDERGAPRVKGWEMIYVGIVKDVSSKVKRWRVVHKSGRVGLWFEGQRVLF